MKTSRILILRHLTVVALALGIALLSAGSTAPVALGYYVAGPVSAPAARDRLAENAVNGLEEEDLPAMAPTATFDVACGDVVGPSGLIAVIGTANGNGEDDVINLAADCVYTLIAADNDTDGPNGLPSILPDGDHSVTVNGNGATIERSTVVGIPAFRIFHVSSGADLILGDLTVKNGRTMTEAGGGIYNAGTLTLNDSTVRDNTTGDGDDAVGGDAGDGGGIYNAAGAHLTLNESTVSDNATGAGGDQGASAQAGHGGHGGGIYSTGVLTATNSTVSGNATGPGGDGLTVPGGDGGAGAGIHNAGTLTLSSSTVVSNTTAAGGSGSSAGDAGSGGGISNSGAVTATNTIIANNAVASGGAGPDCQGALSSQDYNLIESTSACTISGVTAHNITGQDPQLSPLRDGGGSTETHALLSGSPAIDAGNAANCPAADQRGVARPQDGDGNGTSTCDIGAYERRYVPLWTVTTTADEFGVVDDVCSLREAIQAANTNQDFGGCRIEAGSHTITLTAGTYTLTIAGSGEDDNATGDLDVTTDLIIDGAGADTTVIDANYLDRVLHIHNGATVELRNVALTNGLTLADGPGGGINNAGRLTITSSRVVSNTTGSGASRVGADGGDGAHGGGIYNSGEVTVVGSVVEGNATGAGGSVSLDPTTGAGGTGGAGGDGGGIYNTGHLTVTNSSLVTGNTAGPGGSGAGSNGGAGGRGGGIYNIGHLTVAESNVQDNASGAGGNAALGPSGGGMGGAGGDGGGIYSTGYLTVTTNSIVGSNATGAGGAGAGGDGGAGGSGGGIYSTSQLMITDGISVTDNTTGAGGLATSGSGGDGGSGGGIYSTGQVTVTDNSLVEGNATGAGAAGDAYDGIAGHGGGIYNDGGTVILSGSTVSDNATDSSGGGIYSAGSLTLTGSTVRQNSAQDGGGISSSGAVTVTQGLVISNTAQLNGGGIYNTGDLTVEDSSTVSGNAAQSGGGIYDSNGTVSVTGSTISDNSVSLNGGGIYSIGDLTVEDGSIISGNSAQSGGGVYHGQGTASIANTTVADNTTSSGGTASLSTTAASSTLIEASGGGIYNSGDLTLTDGTVSDNTAKDGGGIRNAGTMAVSTSMIRANEGVLEGGGISNSGILSLSTSTVRDNSSQYGGGISSAGTLTVTQSTLVNNAADFEGGGIRNSGTTTLINSTISTNSANWGGGIYDRFGNVDARFTTIAGNSAVQGGASVYNQVGTVVTLLATIIAEPQGKPNCAGDGLTSTGGGFNRISDTSCQLQNADPDNDKENAVIQLLPLDDYGGPTLTHKPVADLDNEVVDIMPGDQCRQAFEPDDAVDQRGKHRPSIGVRVEGVFVSPDDAPCDAGAVELRTRVQRVCGPPLAHTNAAGEFVVEPEFAGRCYWPTVADALQQAEDGDTIIISGVITETVTVNKSVTIEGPTRDEITPGTHMGIVQADLDQPDGSRTRGSVFSIPHAISVTIKNLNIRHGDADTGGGIKNGGLLTLEGVTIYDNAANRGGAIYNSGTLTVENSSLLDNLGEDGGAGIYNARAMPDDDGLALWLPFDEPSGATQFADESGNGRDASCSGSYCPTAGVDGRHAKALQFDGSDDRADISNTPDIDDLQQLTVAAWVKLNSLPNRVMRFVTLRGEKAVLRYDGTQYGGPGQLHFYMNFGGSLRSIRVDNALTTGVFQHVAGTYDGSTMRLYLDGVELRSRGVSGTVATGGGIMLSASGGTLDGLLDDVLVYDRALSESEIEALFYAGDGTARVTHATLADNIIPGWTPSTISSDADGAYAVYAVDMDKDGDPEFDVISASYNDDKIAWYENTAGDGTAWTAHTIVDVNSIPDSGSPARSGRVNRAARRRPALYPRRGGCFPQRGDELGPLGGGRRGSGSPYRGLDRWPATGGALFAGAKRHRRFHPGFHWQPPLHPGLSGRRGALSAVRTRPDLLAANRHPRPPDRPAMRCDSGQRSRGEDHISPAPLSPGSSASSQHMLEYLESANLFIVPLDDERRWYRYHHLFADLLRARLKQAQSDRLPALHRRASEWYDRNGLAAEAVGHALAAEDFERAARLVEQNARPTSLRGEMTMLLGWLEALPDELVRTRPWLCIFHAWALLLTGQLNGVEPRLQDAVGAIREPSLPDDVQGEVTAIRAYVAALRGDAPRTIELARQALERLPEDNLIVRSVVAFTLGGACLLSGDVVGAGQAFADASAIGQAAGNIHVAVPALGALAGLQVVQGQLHQAAETYHDAVQLAAERGGRPLPVAAGAYSGMGELLYEWNDLEAAMRHVMESLELSQQWGNIDALTSSYVALARVRQAQGDLDTAFDMLEQADQIVRGHTLTPTTDARLTAYRMQLWLAKGNLATAARCAMERELSPSAGLRTGVDDEPSYLHEIEHITLARVLIGQGKLDEAIGLLTRLLQAAEAGGRMGHVIEILALQALALQAQGDTARAMIALERALSLAEPEGYVRAFVDEGAPMAELLLQVGKLQVAGSASHAQRLLAYVNKLLAAFELEGSRRRLEPFDKLRTPPSTFQPSTLIEPLSERELEVLRLVVAGLSNREIAQELVIAVSTVKSHINHIFGKLGVKSRTQAVARAKALDLL